MNCFRINTGILAYDHNWDQPEYPQTILAGPAAAQYVPGSAFHGYGREVSAQGKVHDKYPDKGLWMMECSGGYLAEGQSAGNY